MSTSITREEWLSELERLGVSSMGPGDPGSTSQELADVMGWSRDKVNQKIRAAVRAGSVLVGFAPRHRIDGQAARVPVYRLAPQPKQTKQTKRTKPR